MVGDPSRSRGHDTRPHLGWGALGVKRAALDIFFLIFPKGVYSAEISKDQSSNERQHGYYKTMKLIL